MLDPSSPTAHTITQRTTVCCVNVLLQKTGCKCHHSEYNLFIDNFIFSRLKIARVSELTFLFYVSLDCKPSGLKPLKSSNSSCPAMPCEGSSLLLGNSTSSVCNTTTCAYAGFSKQTIFTNISTLNTCPGPEGELQTSTLLRIISVFTNPGSDANTFYFGVLGKLRSCFVCVAHEKELK